MSKISRLKSFVRGVQGQAVHHGKACRLRLCALAPARVLVAVGVLVAVLIGFQAWMNLTLSSHALTASESAVHRTIAHTFADRLRQIGAGSSNGKLFTHVRELAALNPSVRLYLVDEHGIVRASPEGYGKVRLPFVDLRAIKRFQAKSKSQEIVFGDDPHALKASKPISVAPIKIDGKPHFVYVVLGEGGLSDAFSRRAALTVGTTTVLLGVFTVSILAGLSLFALNSKLSGVSASLAAISHDLRGPLTSVQGYLETLLERGHKLDRSSSERYMSVALKNTKSMAGMVNDLHYLAKIDASGEQIEMEPLSIGDLVMDITLSLSPQFEEKGVKVTAHVPEILPLVSGNLPLIERLVRNLVENALRYTPEKGAVTVTVSPLPGKVRITVADNGCGIPADELEKVQTQFYRGAHVKHSTQGSGIGLSIAKRVAELHGSSLTLLSKEGEGTAALFELTHHVGRSSRERVKARGHSSST